MSSHLAIVDPEWRSKCQPQRHKTLRERFDEKTERDLATGCLLWRGAHDKDGYGFIRIQGKNVKAHRVALGWKLGRSLLPSENALHRCDRPACVEQSHLFEGSNSDNQIDALMKGRSPCARLTPDDVLSIRSRHLNGESGAYLARQYGVSGTQIRSIVRRLKWKHVA